MVSLWNSHQLGSSKQSVDCETSKPTNFIFSGRCLVKVHAWMYKYNLYILFIYEYPWPKLTLQIDEDIISDQYRPIILALIEIVTYQDKVHSFVQSAETYQHSPAACQQWAQCVRILERGKTDQSSLSKVFYFFFL